MSSEMRRLLLLLLLPCCTIYREPGGHLFAQLGGKVQFATPRFEAAIDNEGSFKEATRLAGTLGVSYIAAGVFKAQSADKAAVDKAGIDASTKAREIDAAAAKDVLDNGRALRAMELGL